MFECRKISRVQSYQVQLLSDIASKKIKQLSSLPAILALPAHRCARIMGKSFWRSLKRLPKENFGYLSQWTFFPNACFTSDSEVADSARKT